MINMRKLLESVWLAHLSYFSKPAGDRILYRTLRRIRAAKILELGVGHGHRARRMIKAASRRAAPVSYAGIDLFESRTPSGDGLTLKQAHALLRPTEARIRLIPGDPFAALARMANEIGPCDLIVIGADQPADSLERAWFYLPRLLHAATAVFHETAASGEAPAHFQPVSHEEIRRRASLCGARRRAA